MSDDKSGAMRGDRVRLWKSEGGLHGTVRRWVDDTFIQVAWDDGVIEFVAASDLIVVERASEGGSQGSLPEPINGYAYTRDEITKIASPILKELNKKGYAKGGVQPDPVREPTHYKGHPKGIEAIDVIEDNPFPNLANVLKYCWRVSWGGKSNDLQDLEKMVWYGQREIARRKRAEPH